MKVGNRMSTYRIAVDLMGSDDAPKSEIDGIKAILAENASITIDAFGLADAIATAGFTHERLTYHESEEVVTGDDEPAFAYRRKKKSSMIQAIQFVKDGNADAIVSSGNTGAYISATLFMLGRIKGIKRPALTTFFPTEDKGRTFVFADLGAVSDPTAEILNQNGILTSEIAKIMLGKSNPKVALLNIGIEEGKGSEVYIQAHQLLKHNDKINFVGNIEARYILEGTADCVVADGFAGNIALKSYEGMQLMISKLLRKNIMSTLRTKIGGMLIKPALRGMKETLDYESIGGAVIAGVKAPAIKSHGTTNGTQFASAIRMAVKFLEKDLVHNIQIAVEDKE